MHLNRDDLWSLEEYSEKRPAFRADVIAHKKNRKVFLGPHATLYFEDATTMKYQIQEMLRIEKIFNRAEIQEELDAYNPLIPDGSNWKATFMIEYPDVEERAAALAHMGGVEETVWVRVGDGAKIYAVTNEDLDRSRDDKAAAVHFMRFELSETDRSALRSGAALSMGIDHDALPYTVDVPANVVESLTQDLT